MALCHIFRPLLSKEIHIWNSWYWGPLVWPVLKKWYRMSAWRISTGGHYLGMTSCYFHFYSWLTLMSKSWAGEMPKQICKRAMMLKSTSSLFGRVIKDSSSIKVNLWPPKFHLLVFILPSMTAVSQMSILIKLAVSTVFYLVKSQFPPYTDRIKRGKNLSASHQSSSGWCNLPWTQHFGFCPAPVL